jgi:deoxyribodipyrimidine photo-lyase
MKLLDIDADLESIVSHEFESLHSGGGRSSIQGGQTAADHDAVVPKLTVVVPMRP